MDLPEEDTHAFLVRLWLEPREVEGAAPEWRGMIEHIESGERRYFREWAETAAFVKVYAAGINKRQSWRGLWRWMSG